MILQPPLHTHPPRPSLSLSPSQVSCPDIEGILINAAKRERTIPPDVIRQYNLDRCLHFLTAAQQLQSQPCNLRLFVVHRENADAASCLHPFSSYLILPYVHSIGC